MNNMHCGFSVFIGGGKQFQLQWPKVIYCCDVVVVVVKKAIQNKCDKYNSFQFYFNVWFGGIWLGL